MRLILREALLLVGVWVVGVRLPLGDPWLEAVPLRRIRKVPTASYCSSDLSSQYILLGPRPHKSAGSYRLV